MKNKSSFKDLKKVFIFSKKYLPAIIIATICAIIGAITTIIGPEKIKELTDLISKGINGQILFSKIIKIAVILIIIYVIGAIFSYAQQFIMATITQNTSRNLRSSINKKINKLPLSYFDKTTKGDILSRVTNDVDILSQTLGNSLANLVSALVLFIGVTIRMFFSNWILALVTIGSSVFGFIFIGLILKHSQKYFTRKQQLIGSMNGHVEEIYSNHKTVKAYLAENSETKRFEKTNNDIYDTEWKAEFLASLMMPIMTFAGNLSYLLIFVVGISLLISGSASITIGTLLAFIIYAKLFSQPLTTFGQSFSSLQQAGAASARVFEILDAEELPDESNKTKKLENIKGEVEFKNVMFGYEKDKLIIKDFSIKIPAGKKVAIVGPTGAGKTTLVNLLMRFYELNSGEILIDNTPLTEITRENVHDLFDMILQDSWLFEGSLRENLVYNKQNVSDEELDKVCSAVGLSHLVSKLKNKYDTILDENTAISEGQKQQITIARAMIKNSPLLILDEATSNVDTRTELIIQQAMDKLTMDRTSFIIAHRLSTIKNADIILVLKDGDIIEQGNHQELLNKKGFYAELYNSQFLNEDD